MNGQGRRGRGQIGGVKVRATSGVKGAQGDQVGRCEADPKANFLVCVTSALVGVCRVGMGG